MLRFRKNQTLALLFALVAFLAVSVHCEDYQIPLPASDMATNELQEEEVSIYALTKLTQEEEDVMIAALCEERDEDNSEPMSWVKPTIVPWTGPNEGTLDDMYRMWREMRNQTDKHMSSFFFFLDRQCIEERRIIVASVDAYSLVYEQRNRDEVSEILRNENAKVTEMHEGIAEIVYFELLNRALTFGRLPAYAFRSSWANLDIANMDLSEILESYEAGKVELYRNPDWDVKDFVGKVEEADKKVKEDDEKRAREKQQPGEK